MKRFKNILFVFEQSVEQNDAFLRAVHTAKRNEARLTVAVTVEDMPDDPGAHPDALLADTWWSFRQALSDQVEELLAPLRKEGLASGGLVLGGTPFLEVVHAVQRLEVDLLMKAARPVSGTTRELLFGSTDMHLMRKCPCPVWIQKERHAGPYRRLLAAIDVERDDPETLALNRLILDLATSLATREDAELKVLHAWSVPGESALRGRAFFRMASDQVDEMLEQERVKREEAFERLLAPYRSGFDFQAELVKGDPRARIPACAAHDRTDLIVMGTVGRSGLPGLIMGNTAEDILRQVDCSVLTVKPDGFVSPVRLDD